MKWLSPESVDIYISHQPAWAQSLLQQLRSIVRTAVPGAEECVKYTVPFYTYHGLLCFLSAKKEHVVLALCEGASLKDPFDILTGIQKRIRHIEISPGDTIPEKGIRFLLVEAARYNELRQQVKLSGKSVIRRKR